jgi:hypothetical protein
LPTFLKVLNRFKSNQQDVKQLVIGDIQFADKTWSKIAVACPNLTHLTIDTSREAKRVLAEEERQRQLVENERQHLIKQRQSYQQHTWLHSWLYKK